MVSLKATHQKLEKTPTPTRELHPHQDDLRSNKGKAVTARHLPEEAIKPTMENPDIQHFFGKKLKIFDKKTNHRRDHFTHSCTSSDSLPCLI